MPSAFPIAGATIGSGVTAPNVVGVNNQTFSTTALGEYEFPFNPAVNTVHKKRDSASVDTYSGAQNSSYEFKSQQSGLIGSEWELLWEIVSGTFYNQLKAYYESTQPVTWDPKERAHLATKKYIVNIVSFEPEDDNRILAYDKVMGVRLVVNIRSVV